MTGQIEKSLTRVAQAQYGQAYSNAGNAQTQSRNDITNDQPVTGTSRKEKNRRMVHVNKLSERYLAMTCMIETAVSDDPKHIIFKFVRQFPEYFPVNMRGSQEKVFRLWKAREDTMLIKMDKKCLGFFFISSTQKYLRLSRKGVKGYGPKRAL